MQCSDTITPETLQKGIYNQLGHIYSSREFCHYWLNYEKRKTNLKQIGKIPYVESGELIGLILIKHPEKKGKLLCQNSRSW